MAEAFDILARVKAGLGVTGDFQDETLQGYIDEVKAFLLDAGVAQEIVDGEASAGAIARGVADLWDYGAGKAALSPYFLQRAEQLSYKDRGD